MLVAIAEAMAENGYVGTSVTDIIKRAGVSRETFYQQFSSKQDCFLAAFSVAGDLLRAQLGELASGPGTAAQRVTTVIEGYLESVIAHPAFARLFLIEAHAAGLEAMQARAQRQQALAHTLADAFERDDDTGYFATEILVAGIGAIVTVPLLTGDVEALRSLRDPLIQLANQQLLA
jgi:AcrR family transcriptional regulator